MHRFVINRKEKGYSFAIADEKNGIVAESIIYSSLQACGKGISSMKKNVGTAGEEDHTGSIDASFKCPKFEIITDAAGNFRFRYLAKNGRCIVVSRGYKRYYSVLEVIEQIRTDIHRAEIEKP